MKKAILASLCFLYMGFAHAQDNPYAIFGYKVKTILKDEPEELLNVPNKDLKSKIKSFTFDPINKCVWLKDADGKILGNVPIEPTEIKRFLSIDPLAEKYYDQSPYNYVLNNPIRYIDPDGREVWINYGDSQRVRYDNGKLYNENGSKYKGKDGFVSTVSKYLGMMAKTEIGNSLLSSLSSSKNSFNFLNEKPKSSGTASFAANSNSDSQGGIIRAGNLSGGRLDDIAKLEVVAHELFHAYENENKEYGPSINNEVGGYLFGAGVVSDYQDGMRAGGFGKIGPAGQVYDNAMNSMLINGYNQKQYETAVRNFKTGSASNVPTPTRPNGLYNDFPIKPISTNPLIRTFSPYIR